jgi:hypothetical protein
LRCGEEFWIGVGRSERSIPAAGGDAHDNEVQIRKDRRPEGFRAKAIVIGFTDRQFSTHGASALFRGWLRPLNWCKTLAAALPQPLPASNNKLLPVEKALALAQIVFALFRFRFAGAAD